MSKVRYDLPYGFSKIDRTILVLVCDIYQKGNATVMYVSMKDIEVEMAYVGSFTCEELSKLFLKRKRYEIAVDPFGLVWTTMPEYLASKS